MSSETIYCNARKKHQDEDLEKREPGPHAGEGYCEMTTSGGRCRIHGGESVPPGPEHHSYKNGRHSKYVPDNLKEKFEAALDDDEYMSLMAEISLVDARIDEVLETIDSTGSLDDLEAVSESYADVRDAYEDGDGRALAEALDSLEETVNAYHGRQESWSELGELLELRKDLVSEERRQAEFLAQTVHREQFITIMDTLADSIKRSLEKNVDDPEERDAVLRDVTREIQSTFQ